MVRLGDLFDFKNGRSFKKTEWKEAGLPIIRIQNLNKTCAGFNYFEGDYDPAIEVNRKDLLFSWSGTVGSSFGPHIWGRDTGVLNQHIFKISFKTDMLLKYAYYSLLFITEEIERSVVGAVGLVHVTKKSLNEFKIPAPAILEQKRVVAILDQAFADIDKTHANSEQNLKSARELFESYLRKMLIQHGEKWNNDRLDYLLLDKPRNGWSPPAKNHSDIGIPVLTLSSVTGFEFKKHKIKYTSAPTKLDAHYWVNNGDLLITRSNTPELVGHVAISSKIEVPTIYPDLIMKLKLDPKKVVTKFIYYQLRSDRLRRIITNSAQGANPTMKKINQGIVQGLPITYPSIKKQETIVKTLDSIYEASLILEENYRVKLENLNELKISILQKAFSGRLTDHIVKVH